MAPRAEHQPDYCPMCQAPNPALVRQSNGTPAEVTWSNVGTRIRLDEWHCITDGDIGRQGCGYRFWTEAKPTHVLPCPCGKEHQPLR